MAYDLDRLNYHHLRYFWIVAREGGINPASEALDVAASTISAQVSALERSLGARLFRRSGRRLALTDAGQAAFRFAEEIFRLGQDLSETLSGRPVDRPQRLSVGIADVVPKLVAIKLLEPALALPEGVRLACGEGKPEELLASLALHRFDVAILDAPAGPGSKVRAHSHRLAQSAVVLLGTPELARRYRPGFPGSLAGAPLLLPSYESALRPEVERWLAAHGLEPEVAGEFDDSALMKAFGERGLGLLPAPSIAAAEACRQYGLEPLAELDGIAVAFYAVTVERKLEHRAVTALVRGAGGAGRPAGASVLRA